jgi:hypothetical protein
MSVSSLYGSRCGLVLNSEERGSAVTSDCWQCTIVHYMECWQCTIVHYRSIREELDTNPSIPRRQPKLPCDSHGLRLRPSNIPDLKENSWFENEEGGEGRCCGARGFGQSASSSCLGVFLGIFCRHVPGLVTSFAKLFFAPLPKRVLLCACARRRAAVGLIPRS